MPEGEKVIGCECPKPKEKKSEFIIIEHMLYENEVFFCDYFPSFCFKNSTSVMHCCYDYDTTNITEKKTFKRREKN